MSIALLSPRTPRTERPLSLESLDFELPQALAASEPPEARGLARDEVRLMVSRVDDDALTHASFRDFPNFLDAGDVLVVNASATINAALDAWRKAENGSAERIELHLSSPLPTPRRRWVVELRRITASGNAPLLTAKPGEHIRLPGGATATLVEPFRPKDHRLVEEREGDSLCFALHAPELDASGDIAVRLWVADLEHTGDVLAYAAKHGSPIRYDYVRDEWPLEYYQTVFATDAGSAEMPSAGRPFTHEIIVRLQRKGVRVVPIVLHTGVASLESDEPPYPERFSVSATTADAVNRAHAGGGRVVAVGTTVVRALETVASVGGWVEPGAGRTELVITPERGVRAVDALLTGLHAPRSSHLAMLESLASRRHLAHTYEAALRHQYLWHEFGDVHLIMRKGGVSS
jgi:S-adenosylmethionine:tRNA ribosyltransferase-isomerase